MPDSWKISARQEIDALNAEFAYLIDNGGSEHVADLFTEDGIYSIRAGDEDLLRTGREAIRAAYAACEAGGTRTSCHLFTNLHVTFETPVGARGHCILLLFAQDGFPPHPAIPALVARYDDHYQRDEDGQWRYTSRRATSLFRSDADSPFAVPLGLRTYEIDR